MEKIGKFIGLCIALYLLVMALNFVTVNHIQVPGIPHAESTNCQATVVAEDGAPPPGTSQPDPQKLCNALDQAEKDAACMGDYNPPPTVNARQLCIEIHNRGCGDSQQYCNKITADQTYYMHH